MEQKPEIFVGPVKEQSAKAYERADLGEDIKTFNPHLRTLLHKRSAGDPLSPEEQTLARDAIEKWWEDKYGFPYSNKVARKEVLMHKHAPSEHTRASQDAQTKLLEVIATGDEEEIRKKRRKYENEYPDQLEGITILFGLKDFFETQRTLQEGVYSGRDKKEFAKEKEELTQFHFLISHFVELNSNNKPFMKNFWHTLEHLSHRIDFRHEFDALKASTLTQVAVYKIFQELECNPRWAIPKEDAFHGIDLWADKDPVQVKGTKRNKPSVYEVDAVSFPGVEAKIQRVAGHYNSSTFLESQILHGKWEEYAKVIGRSLKGYVIQVPYSEIDGDTGDPSSDLVETVRSALADKPEKKAA